MIQEQKTKPEVAESLKKDFFTTEIFKGKTNVPDFIINHKVFRTKTPIKKIFPSIGLENFKEPCNISKPLLDLKKENFVSTLVGVMLNTLVVARDEVQIGADRIQFLLEGEEQTKNIAKLEEFYNLAEIARNLIPQIDTYNNAYEKIVQTQDGKIVLRLADDVMDRAGKAVFRKNESLFRVFGKLREQFTAINVQFTNIEQTNEFKTFSAENVPNKKFMVIFSATGEQGAWDLLTMSMRGIKSCQRWDGEYHRCLIGSILSKFTGIIYITSGTDFEGRGPKMMRRSIVRYAIDADEHKPCILVDKMYPEFDEESLKVFTDALSTKTKLPVYYAPNLSAKVRHFYIPFEKMREEIPERDWTYQDTPLKTNLDFQIHVIASASNEDVTRYINCFKAKLVAYVGEYFRDVLSHYKSTDEEIRRTISNIRLNSSIDKFNEQMVTMIFNRIHYTPPKTYPAPRDCYRKYLLGFALQLKDVRKIEQTNLNAIIDRATSRSVNHQQFCDFLFGLILNFAKQELKTLVN